MEKKQKLQETMIQLSFEIANISQSIEVYEKMRSEKLAVYAVHHQELKELLQNEINNEKED